MSVSMSPAPSSFLKVGDWQPMNHLSDQLFMFLAETVLSSNIIQVQWTLSSLQHLFSLPWLLPSSVYLQKYVYRYYKPWSCGRNTGAFFLVVVWRSGSALVPINEVNLRQARWPMGWVTVSGFNSRCGRFISICNQLPRPIQPGHPFVGRRNEYQPKGGDALRLGSKGRYGSCVGGRKNCVIPLLHAGYIWALSSVAYYMTKHYKFTLFYFTFFCSQSLVTPTPRRPAPAMTHRLPRQKYREY